MIQKEIIRQLALKISEEIDVLARAAQETKSASIHAESQPEDQHDTRSTEASYLAAGQFKRVQELKAMLKVLEDFSLEKYSARNLIGIGALATLEFDKKYFYYFLSPVAGGYKIFVDEREISVVTPQSIMGQELLDKSVGDIVQIPSQRSKIYTIKKIS